MQYNRVVGRVGKVAEEVMLDYGMHTLNSFIYTANKMLHF